MADTYFPIRTATSCQLKWNWTALYLNGGFSRTCHRTAETQLTPENFNNFHNTEIVLDDRKRMLQGLWPEKSCSYCKNIEEAGGVSDRLRQIDNPNLTPAELLNDSTAIVVSPVILEVFFDNTCNLGCLYCTPTLSSSINAENLKFSNNKLDLPSLRPINTHSKTLVPYFWEWFPTGFPKIKRLHVLGGEPFYQREFEKLLSMIEQYPNPECELNIITNLMVSSDRLTLFVEKFKKLVSTKKIKRVDITCSLDCWGPQQEYVRWGVDLKQWQQNFEFLLKQNWLYLSLNQTITVLTIKTMPELLTKLKAWNTVRPVHHSFSAPNPGPSYFNAGILGGAEFKTDFDHILSLMPQNTDEDKITYKYMLGIANSIIQSEVNPTEITKLLTYLDEKDHRRGTDWETLFPWLLEYKKYVV
jgi:organic radical activating enzyme